MRDFNICFINPISIDPSDAIRMGEFMGENKARTELLLSRLKQKQKINWGETALGAANAASGIVGGLLSNGLSTGAGNTLLGLSSVAGMIPGPIGQFASAGLNVIGGAINGLFGSKLNELFINNKESEINSVANLTSVATTTDLFLADLASMRGVEGFSLGDVGKDGPFSNKALNEFNRLQKNALYAMNQALHNMFNASENINSRNQMSALSNYSAEGGPLNESKDFNNTFDPRLFCTGGLIFDEGGKLRPLKEINKKINDLKPKYNKGGIYDIDEKEYQRLLDLGYKIKILN